MRTLSKSSILFRLGFFMACGGWFSFWVAGAIIGGSLITGIGASDAASSAANAQNNANATAAQAAKDQSAQSFYNSLQSRGVDIHSILANNPTIAAQIGTDPDALYTYLQANPTSPLWSQISNPSPGAGAANTTQPNTSTIGGQPAQPVLAQSVGAIYQGWPATLQAWAQANPTGWQVVTAMNPGTPTQSLTPQQVTSSLQQWYQQNPGTPISPVDQNLITQAGAIQAAPSGAVSATTQQQNQLSNQNLTNLLSGQDLTTQFNAALPAMGAHEQAAIDTQNLIDQTRQNNQATNTAQLTGLANLLGANTQGAQNIYATGVQGAGALQTAQQGAAQGIDTSTLAGLANLLGVQTTGANNVYGATTNAASALQSAQDTSAQGISTADLAGLANLLGVQNTSAQNLFAAQNTGAQNIYGAQLTQAQTYAQAARQALDQQLSEQQAQQARQGFIGNSSGASLQRARLMAQYLQAGAGATAGAGVSLQQALAGNSQGLQQNLGAAAVGQAQGQLQNNVNLASALGAAGTGYAQNVGQAGINQAGTIAAAQAGQAQGQLQAGVNLATALGAANTGYASNVGALGLTQAQQLAQAQSQNQAGILAANTQLGLANQPLTNASSDIAQQNAAYDNVMQYLGLVQQNQASQLGALNAPSQLATNQANATATLAAAPYVNTNAAAGALAPYATAPASGSTLTSSNPGAVLGTGQVVGAGLQAVGAGLTNYGSTQSLASLLASLGNNGSAATATSPATGSFASSSGILSGLGQNLTFDNPSSTGSMSGVLGGVCWIAREVYGAMNPKWMQFRNWLMNKAGAEIRDFYENNGQEIAARIRDDLAAKMLLRSEFDRILEAA